MEISPEIIGGSPVRKAIADASKSTGADFGFLLATAQRESSLNPMAEAKTSSATGLFQFLNQSWLVTLKRHGAKHGLANEAAQIEMGADGKAYVENATMRRKLLDLRYDPKISALMAAEFSQDNGDYIRARTGIEPQAGDLYAAHFLGAGGAASLINAANSTPWAKASDLFPAAAAANRPVFYSNGRALSVSEVLDGLRATAKNIPKNIGKSEFVVKDMTKDNDSQNAALMASLQTSWGNSLLSMLNGGVGNNGGQSNIFNASPLLLAQYYQANDEMHQVKAMEIATEALSSADISQALAPTPKEEEPPILRGRK